MISFFKRLPHKFRRALILGRHAIEVIRQFNHIKSHHNPRFKVMWKDRWLHLRDATATTGFDKHYVFHTAWAARKIADLRPKQHIDIASSLIFVGSVSAFVPTRFIDFRPAEMNLSNLKTEPGTLMQLPFANDVVESLSCMHVVEHVGLGRYGDPLDYDGDIKAAKELSRVVAPGGTLLFVVPIGGTARIQFNAHRIYTYEQVLDLFPSFDLEEFALIPDDGAAENLIRYASAEQASKQNYGCGCFHLKKPSSIYL
jgi:SAM-dependent methyltransferase